MAEAMASGCCSDCRKLRRVMLVLLVLLGVFCSSWVWELGNFGLREGKLKGGRADDVLGKYNLSKEQLQALDLLLSSINQGKFFGCMEQYMPDGAFNDELSYSSQRLGNKNDHSQQCWRNEDGIILQKKVACSSGAGYASGTICSPEAVHFSDNAVQNTVLATTENKFPSAKDYRRIFIQIKESPHKVIQLALLSITFLVLVGLAILWKNSTLCVFLRSRNQQVEQDNYQPINSKDVGKWMTFLYIGVLTGIGLAAFVFLLLNAKYIEARKETLVNMCDERARMLQDQFNASMNHVHALAILLSTFHHGKDPSAIDQKTFADYTARTAFARPLISGVAYAIRVLHSERERFEKQHGWRIKKMDTEDQSPVQDDYIPEKLDPSPVQDEYAPVILSQETVSHIVSIDMMSGKEDRENILRARATGKGVLTSPFNLLKSNYLGVVLTFAVYDTELPANATPEERINATLGYLGASFDVPSLVEKLLHQLASKQTIVVNLYDTTNASAHIKMYGPDATGSKEMYITNVDFGDPNHKHEIHCRFKHGAPLPSVAISAALAILSIVALVAHIFHATINRLKKVHDDYLQMKELKVRAEAADIAKSQFLATVSHEIRTPMNGVLGMLQMLMDTDLDATQQDYALTAQNSGKALITLINEVLDQAKIESGRLELEAVPFNVHDILDNVISLFSDKSQAKGIELAVYVSNRVPEVLIGDPGRFRQITTNLVGNSVKFTEAGHIFVTVLLVDEARSSCDSGNLFLKVNPQEFENEKLMCDTTLSGFRVLERHKSWEHFNIFKVATENKDSINLLVTVEDTGVGIPPEAQSRIFTPFMQADSSMSRTYGGTGIGLSISKCLVNLMGGEIGFVSKHGIGSTFSFTAVLREGRKNSVDIKRHKKEPTSSEFAGLRVLVADGRRVRAEIIKYYLERLGLQVETANSQESAVTAILDACKSSENHNLDVVLVDKEAWGEGSGVAFSRPLMEVRKRGTRGRKSIKLLLLATSVNSSEVTDIKAAGYSDIIMKPLRLSMIAASLRKTLGLADKKQLGTGQPMALQNLLCGKHVLVVDDNAVNRRVASGVLKKFGATITCRDSGKAAIALLQPPHGFDACFMDVQMPEMDGFESTRQIRAIEAKFNALTKSDEASAEMYRNAAHHWHVPILAMTADVIQATYEECLRCGMDGYVSKPFEEQQLYSAIANLFKSDTVEEAIQR